MNKWLSALIWAGAWIAISVVLLALVAEGEGQLALLIIIGSVAYVLFRKVYVLFIHIYVLFIHVLKYVPVRIERPLGIISVLVDNNIVTYLVTALMLGLILREWTIKKEQDKVARTIALRILDNLDGTRQQELSNLSNAEPNARQRIMKAIRKELRRRMADEIALIVLYGGPKMQALMNEILLQMPIKIQRDIERAKKEEWHWREAWERPPEEEARRWREARERPEARRRREARRIDRLFIEENTDGIVLRFFSGEFQDREYVIKKIRETNAEFQSRLEEAIREKQSTLLKNPQTSMPKKAFVYLIRQEDFAQKQFFFKIGWAKNPGNRLRRLQTGNPHLLHLWATMPFPNDAAAQQKEKDLHEVCQAWQKRSEWFQGHMLEELLQAENFTPYFNNP